jgi:hypothetical protein
MIESRLKRVQQVEIASGLFKFQSEEKWEALKRECEARGWKMERKGQAPGYPGTGLTVVTKVDLTEAQDATPEPDDEDEP